MLLYGQRKKCNIKAAKYHIYLFFLCAIFGFSMLPFLGMLFVFIFFQFLFHSNESKTSTI